jgi:hypothetical protein
MPDLKRVSIGFGGGQTAAIRLSEEQLDELRQALTSTNKLSSESASWYELEAEDGPVSLDLREVVFLRVEGAAATIGFSGS